MNTNRIIKSIQKREKGQIIVLMALMFIGLIAIIGLAVDLGYLFVSYSRLRRAVDSAALASTGQFRQGYSTANLIKEAQQFLDLNGVTDTTDIQIQSCDTNPGDSELCTTPARKLVRVKVTQMVPLFFLSVVGLHQIPITVDAISEAASVDLVLLIDRSTSMAWSAGSPGHQNDPKVCNPQTPGGVGGCHPFEEIKAAAKLLVGRMFLSPDGVTPGYDRVSIVTFDRYPTVQLPMTDNKAIIDSTLDNLTVYQGEGRCPWTAETNAWDYVPNPPDSPALFDGPCRLYHVTLVSPLIDAANPNNPVNFMRDVNNNPIPDSNNFARMDCTSWSLPQDRSLADPRGCMVTNSGGGLKVAGNALGGSYPSGVTGPASRETALWVVVWLTDGFSNIGFSDDGVNQPPTYTSANYNATAICPHYTWLLPRKCLDENANPTAGDLQATPPPAASVFNARHCNQVGCTTGLYDLGLFDPDDYARDMVDFVTDPDNGQGALLFTIGLGADQITLRSASEIANGYPSTGETLLQYGAYKGGGIYYFAPSAAQLNEIFLGIANKIATRLSR